LRGDDDFLDRAAAAAFADCASGGGICIAKLSALHPALARRVVRLAIARVRGSETDISCTHVASVLELARGASGREVHLPGIVAAREYERLIFFAPQFTHQEESTGFCYELEPGVFLRTRRPGDKIKFKTADGKFFTKKLQDYFTDEKIPRRERDKIPLLARGNEILQIFKKTE
jgi:tRNA(Ile)-lysidine synthase